MTHRFALALLVAFAAASALPGAPAAMAGHASGEDALVTRRWALTSEQASRLRVFRDSGMLAQLLCPPDGIARRGESHEIEGRQLTIRGTAEQAERVDLLLHDLETLGCCLTHETRIFRMDAANGQAVAERLSLDLDRQFGPDPDRRVLAQGPNLIVRATRAEIASAESLVDAGVSPAPPE
jgi:hypothetical protein